MRRRKYLLCCSFLVAAVAARLVKGGNSPVADSPRAASNYATGIPSPLSPADDAQIDTPQSPPLVVVIETDDTDELSSREKPSATHSALPLSGPSRRATRVALSLRQLRLNTLNALCVRLQI
jgi:hypothetical protein